MTYLPDITHINQLVTGVFTSNCTGKSTSVWLVVSMVLCEHRSQPVAHFLPCIAHKYQPTAGIFTMYCTHKSTSLWLVFLCYCVRTDINELFKYKSPGIAYRNQRVVGFFLRYCKHTELNELLARYDTQINHRRCVSVLVWPCVHI